MAKRSLPKDPPKESAGPGFFESRGLPRSSLLSEDKVARMDGKEVLENVKGFGKGWDPAVENAFSVPGPLNFMRNDTTGDMFFSMESEFGITDVISSLMSGDLKELRTEYGIGVYEKASSMYIVLADVRRRIVVRDLRMDLHDTEQYKDWGGFVDAVREAEKAAEENPDKIAVHDRTVSLI